LDLRKISSILLLIIFCNSCFYYAYFSFSIIKAKIQARAALENVTDEKTYLKIPCSQLQKDESDEVWYNNTLYDVAKRQSINGTEYIYIVRDENEEDILKRDGDFFKNDTGIFLNTSGYRLNPQKKLQPTSDNNYLINSSKKIFSPMCALRPRAVNYMFFFPSISTEVPTPPPREL
jgi:hypothetical protein